MRRHNPGETGRAGAARDLRVDWHLRLEKPVRLCHEERVMMAEQVRAVSAEQVENAHHRPVTLVVG